MILLYNLLNFNYHILEVIKERLFDEYFDMDILDTDRMGVYIDGGAFTGDTIEMFFQYFNNKKIIGYEITEKVFRSLQKNVLKYGSDVEVKNVGLGCAYGTKYVKEEWNIVGNHLSDKGNYKIKIVPLDADIDEKVAVIKLDIEGTEYDALVGAEKIIKRDKPQLIVCLYHNLEDMFKLPLLIHEFRSDYRFFLRYYGDGIRPLDYVLYAI